MLSLRCGAFKQRHAFHLVHSLHIEQHVGGRVNLGVRIGFCWVIRALGNDFIDDSSV